MGYFKVFVQVKHFGNGSTNQIGQKITKSNHKLDKPVLVLRQNLRQNFYQLFPHWKTHVENSSFTDYKTVLKRKICPSS